MFTLSDFQCLCGVLRLSFLWTLSRLLAVAILLMLALWPWCQQYQWEMLGDESYSIYFHLNVVTWSQVWFGWKQNFFVPKFGRVRQGPCDVRINFRKKYSESVHVCSVFSRQTPEGATSQTTGRLWESIQAVKQLVRLRNRWLDFWLHTKPL